MTIGIIWPMENGMHSQPFALFVLRSWLFNSSYVQSKCKMTSRWVSFAISIWLNVWQEIRAGGCSLMPVLRSLLGTWSQMLFAPENHQNYSCTFLFVWNFYPDADPHRLPHCFTEIGLIFNNKYIFSNKKHFPSWNLVLEEPAPGPNRSLCLRRLFRKGHYLS